MKIKTKVLIGAALDWAVAKCEGVARPYIKDGCCQRGTDFCGSVEFFCYSTDWAQGGPIVEREHIDLGWVESNYLHVTGCWSACIRTNGKVRYAPAPLIAAMRAYVASKLGDEIDVPEELS